MTGHHGRGRRRAQRRLAEADRGRQQERGRGSGIGGLQPVDQIAQHLLSERLELRREAVDALRDRMLEEHFSIPEGAVISRGDLTATLSDPLDSVGDGVGFSAARTATVLFTDIVGSTKLAQLAGDKEWTDTLFAHDQRTRQVLTVYRGREVNTTGDEMGDMVIAVELKGAVPPAPAMR